MSRAARQPGARASARHVAAASGRRAARRTAPRPSAARAEAEREQLTGQRRRAPRVRCAAARSRMSERRRPARSAGARRGRSAGGTGQRAILAPIAAGQRCTAPWRTGRRAGRRGARGGDGGEDAEAASVRVASASVTGAHHAGQAASPAPGRGDVNHARSVRRRSRAACSHARELAAVPGGHEPVRDRHVDDAGRPRPRERRAVPGGTGRPQQQHPSTSREPTRTAGQRSGAGLRGRFTPVKPGAGASRSSGPERAESTRSRCAADPRCSPRPDPRRFGAGSPSGRVWL